MATAPAPNPGLMAIGSIGSAINAVTDRRAAQRMGQLQLDQLAQSVAKADAIRAEQIAFDQRARTERIAYDSASLAEQIARERQNLEIAKADQDANIARTMASMQGNLAARQGASDRAFAASGREVGRQQEYGRAQGDAFASSLAQFGPGFASDMGAKQDSLAAIFADILNRDGPASNAPAASGTTADFEAAARAQASGMVGDQANKLAAMQAFGGTMFDKSIAMGRNQQLDAIIQNFARGSQAALAPEVDAASMYFQSNPILTKTPTASLAPRGSYIGERFTSPNIITPQLVKPAPSMLGDLFVGLANVGMQYANRPPAAPSPYELTLPTSARPPGLRMDGGGLGIRTDRPAGLGIR